MARSDIVVARKNSTSSTLSTIATDHLGSTAVLSNASGAMTELLDYHGYGNSRLTSGSATAKKTFIGQYSDSETSLSYLNARYYNPAQGQFLSEDSVFLGMGMGNEKEKIALLDPQLQNSYSYGRDNPMMLRDADGNFAIAAVVLAWAPQIVTAGAIMVANGAGFIADSFNRMMDKSQSSSSRIMAGVDLIGSALPVGAITKSTSASVRGIGAGATSVYKALDNQGATIYVGITNNLVRRAAEHAATKNITISPIAGLTNLSRNVARGVEQTLIERHGLQGIGGTLMNRINSIASTNPVYKELVNIGRALLSRLEK